MTVLLVDDQLSILSGLVAGVNWNALGVTAIRTAGNAIQAKKILEKESVDVLLCDIEMPGESGLDLLRWIRDKKMNLVCVFLTSHADFLYAKEAIQLGCFDYILQPARYEDIQKAVAKAIDRVKLERVDKELASYGQYAKNAPGGGIFQGPLNGWITGGSFPLSRLRSLLHQIHRELPSGCESALVIGQLLRWHRDPWNWDEWTYGLNNILAELCGNAGMETLDFAIDSASLGWLIYAREHAFAAPDEPVHVLENVYLRMAQYFPGDFSFYVGDSLPVEEIDSQAKALMKMKQDNVLQKSGVFPLKGYTPHSGALPRVNTVQLHRWMDLLSEGNGHILCDELFAYLDSLSAEEKFDYEILHSFWLQFQQIVLNVIWNKQLDITNILPVIRRGENAKSLQDLTETVEQTVAFFPQESVQEDKNTLIHRVEQYVEDHLDSPLTVGDIANVMFMNADYLSRLFKDKKGIPLKEHIVNRKMQTAQVLLRTTSLPVGVIAAKVGYESYSYFSQAYKKVIGYSPSEERKK